MAVAGFTVWQQCDVFICGREPRSRLLHYLGARAGGNAQRDPTPRRASPVHGEPPRAAYHETYSGLGHMVPQLHLAAPSGDFKAGGRNYYRVS